MANFTTHLAVGAAVSGIVTTSFIGAGMASPQEAGMYFAAGTIGSLLPDLDHDDSYILRIFFVFMAVGLSSWAVWFFFLRIWSYIELFLIWLAIFLIIYYGLYAIFVAATRHRGLFHSIPAAFFAWALTTFIAFWGFKYNAMVSWMVGFFVWMGYLTHLILDELFSVNIMNVTVKRSWGTAFKFYEPNTNVFLNLFLIFATFALFWWGPSIMPFWNTMFGPRYYSTWGGNFWPRGGWFVYRPGTSGFFRTPYTPPPQQPPIQDQPDNPRDPYQPDRYRDLR